MFPHDSIHAIHFGVKKQQQQKKTQSDVASFSVHLIRKHIMSICPIPGDINFDDLVKMTITKLILSHFRINKYLVRKYFETIF